MIMIMTPYSYVSDINNNIYDNSNDNGETTAMMIAVIIITIVRTREKNLQRSTYKLDKKSIHIHTHTHTYIPSSNIKPCSKISLTLTCLSALVLILNVLVAELVTLLGISVYAATVVLSLHSCISTSKSSFIKLKDMHLLLLPTFMV